MKRTITKMKIMNEKCIISIINIHRENSIINIINMRKYCNKVVKKNNNRLKIYKYLDFLQNNNN